MSNNLTIITLSFILDIRTLTHICPNLACWILMFQNKFICQMLQRRRCRALFCEIVTSDLSYVKKIWRLVFTSFCTPTYYPWNGGIGGWGMCGLWPLRLLFFLPFLFINICRRGLFSSSRHFFAWIKLFDFWGPLCKKAE